MTNVPLRVLMFGWEWPPFNSGGLGIACLGLTRALSRRGTAITFVLPKRVRAEAGFLKFLFCEEGHYGEGEPPPIVYGQISLSRRLPALKEMSALFHYLNEVIADDQFDVIHAHDWMSFAPALAAKRFTGKPLVAHIHSTEFDRTGGHRINQRVYDIERQGMAEADLVVAVSQFTKNKIISHYGIPPRKIAVIHNGVESGHFRRHDLNDLRHLKKNHRLVLFVGRLTLQKGPDYFIQVAKKILSVQPRTRFLVAGSGDMEWRIIADAAYAGISDKIMFAGFLRGLDLNRIYQLADVYVMPSVSEPFGITALEAMANGTPAILSRQSGVVEAVRHTLTVDFWDVDEMANKVVAALRYPALRKCLSDYGRRDAENCTWDRAAEQCLMAYQTLV